MWKTLKKGLKSLKGSKKSQSGPGEKVPTAKEIEAAERKRDKLTKKAMGSKIHGNDVTYSILKVLSTNQFGYTYEAIKIDPATQQPLPKERPLRLKLEVDTNKPEFEYFKTLLPELLILEKIKKHYRTSTDLHLARIYDKGMRVDNYKFFATMCFGETIAEHMQKMPNGCFTKGTAIRVSYQMFKAINDLHRIGNIHCNITPSAFSTGLRGERDVIFLTDFDCAKKYILKDGKHKKQHELQPRGGQLRYMSRDANRNKSLSRRDDLEAWFYVSMELFDKEALPWRNTTNRMSGLRKKKEFFMDPNVNMYKKSAMQYRLILDSINRLSFRAEPDYTAIITLMGEAVLSIVKAPRTPYDWVTFAPTTKSMAPTVSTMSQLNPQSYMSISSVSQPKSTMTMPVASQDPRSEMPFSLMTQRCFGQQQPLIASRTPQDPRLAMDLNVMQQQPLMASGTPQDPRSAMDLSVMQQKPLQSADSTPPTKPKANKNEGSDDDDDGDDNEEDEEEEEEEEDEEEA